MHSPADYRKPHRTAPDERAAAVGRCVHRPLRPGDPNGGRSMSAIRRAEATWSGALTTGSGNVSAISSGSFTSLPVSWAPRTESSDGKTSPEELVAAAHASCFAMALSGALGRAGTPPDRLDVSAEGPFSQLPAGWRGGWGGVSLPGVRP